MSKKDNAGVETTIPEGSELETPSEEDAGVEIKKEPGSEVPEDKTDYKALYEKEVSNNANLKVALSNKRQLRNKDDEPEPDDDDAPVTLGKLRDVIQSTVVPSIVASKEDSILSEKVKDPAKRQLVKFYLDNRIVRTGTSDEALNNDIETALAIADSKRIKVENEELKRANADKGKTVRTAGSGTGEGIPVTTTHKFSEAQVKALTEQAKRLGADPEKFIATAWKNSKR